MIKKRPNVLVIFADQMRGQAMGCAGNQDIETPNLDKLAREGVRFSCANSTFPVCVPFRFTLMTGEYAHSRNVPAILYRMSPKERTIADEFNDAGYETCYVGKWHLHGHDTLATTPEERRQMRVPRKYQARFKRWRGFELLNAHLDSVYWKDDDLSPIPINGFQTDGLFDIAMEEITDMSQEDKPFFMMLSFEPPHDPYEGPEQLEKKYRSRSLKYRPNVSKSPEALWHPEIFSESSQESAIDIKSWTEENLPSYYALIDNADSNVGRMLNHLKKLNILDNTVIFFFSDHGCCLGSHGITTKLYPLEESVNIPLIVHYPAGGISGGRILEEPTSSEDLFPTILLAAGLKPANNLPGSDLCPLMRGEKNVLNRSGVLLEHVREHRGTVPFSKKNWRAYRTRRWKYVEVASEPYALFDMREDQYEMNNLIHSASHIGVKNELKNEMRKRMRETNDNWE
jgi:arylsulfatase A-like enzyme